MYTDFLREIFISTNEYWIVAKKTTYRDCFETRQGNDQILFISIPQGLRRGIKYDEITLAEMELLSNANIDNIYLSEDYPPFQLYTTLREVYNGYPVTCNVKPFLINALQLNSNELYNYYKLMQLKND